MEVFSVSHAEPGGKQPMTGSALARRVKKSSPAVRAALAARIARGEVLVARPTTTQTALLTALSTASVSLVKSALDEDLTALRRGALSLRALRAKRRRKPDVPRSAIAEFVALAGIEPVRAVIDAMTAPTQAAAK